MFSFKLGRDASGRSYPESGVTTGFHNASHHGEREDRIMEFAKINRYHVSMLPYLMEKLKNTPEGDSNLLENSLLIYGSPMGDSNIHNHKRVPLVLMGHAGGKLTGGVHIKAPDGTPMANAMFTTLQALGRTDLQSFGDSTRRARPQHQSGDRHRRAEGVGADMRRTLTTGFSICAMLALSLSTLTHAAAGAAASFVDAAMNGNRDAVRALLKDGADVNTTQADGMTALHWAAQKGDVELAKVLLYASANLKATTRIGGYTPLLIASKNGDARDDRHPDPGRRRRQRAHHERHHAADARRGGRQAGRGHRVDRARRQRQRQGSGQGRDAR